MLQSKHWDIFVLFNFQCKFLNCTNQLKHGDKVGVQYVLFLVPLVPVPDRKCWFYRMTMRWLLVTEVLTAVAFTVGVVFLR